MDSLSRALAAGGAYLLYRAAGGTAIRKKRVASITFMEKLQSIILIGNNKYLIMILGFRMYIHLSILNCGLEQRIEPRLHRF